MSTNGHKPEDGGLSEYQKKMQEAEAAKIQYDALEHLDPITWLSGLEEWNELNLLEIQQIGHTNAKYYAILEGGARIELGSAYDLTQFARIQSAIFAQTKVVISKANYGGKSWERYMKALIKGSSVTETTGDSLLEQCEEWVNDLLTHVSKHERYDLSSKDDLTAIIQDRQRRPGELKVYISTEGEVILRPEGIVNHISLTYGTRIDIAQVRQGLKLLQFEQRILQVWGPQVPKKRFWISPKNYHTQNEGA